MQEVVLPHTWPARYVTGLKKKEQMCTLSNVTVQLMVCRSKHFMSKSVQSRWRLHETDFVKCYNWFHIWTVRIKLFTKKLVVVFLTLVVCPWLWFVALVTGWWQQWGGACEGGEHDDGAGSEWGRGSTGQSTGCLAGGEHSVSAEPPLQA